MCSSRSSFHFPRDIRRFPPILPPTRFARVSPRDNQCFFLYSEHGIFIATHSTMFSFSLCRAKSISFSINTINSQFFLAQVRSLAKANKRKARRDFRELNNIPGEPLHRLPFTDSRSQVHRSREAPKNTRIPEQRQPMRTPEE